MAELNKDGLPIGEPVDFKTLMRVLRKGGNNATATDEQPTKKVRKSRKSGVQDSSGAVDAQETE
jgi:hypothetical protein